MNSGVTLAASRKRRGYLGGTWPLLCKAEGISQATLSSSLRSLERDGSIVRRVFPTVSVTNACSFAPVAWAITVPLAALREWAEPHIDEMTATRAKGNAEGVNRDHGCIADTLPLVPLAGHSFAKSWI